MWYGIQRELKYLMTNKWDLCLVTLLPLFLILILSAMFTQGVAHQLPIAVIDQDQSQLSKKITDDLSLTDALKVTTITTSQEEVEQLLNQNKIWGYVHIPAGAEKRLVRLQDAEINMAYNQSYFSIGGVISLAMLTSTLQAMANYVKSDYLSNDLIQLNLPTANVKLSLLFNPNFNYEFYLEPYVIPSIFHLLLSCCVAFSIGQEFKQKTTRQWLQSQTAIQAILSKNLVYAVIFTLWTLVWMYWLADIKGWFIAGSLTLLIAAQFLFYLAYGLISTLLVLITKKSLEVFGVLAVYGGSSLSFAGVTLPITENTPTFTKFWSNIIPYTHYAKLQTQQWVIGSPLSTSIPILMVLLLFCMISFLICLVLLKRYVRALKI